MEVWHRNEYSVSKDLMSPLKFATATGSGKTSMFLFPQGRYQLISTNPFDIFLGMSPQSISRCTKISWYCWGLLSNLFKIWDLEMLQSPSLTKDTRGSSKLTILSSTKPLGSDKEWGLHFFTISLMAQSINVHCWVSEFGRSKGTENWHIDIFETISCWRKPSEQRKRADIMSKGFTLLFWSFRKSNDISLYKSKLDKSSLSSHEYFTPLAVTFTIISFFRNSHGKEDRDWAGSSVTDLFSICSTSLSESLFG